jgi:hypothetical protein
MSNINLNIDTLNDSLSNFFKDFGKAKNALSYFSKTATNALLQISLNNKVFYTREDIQVLTGYSKSTVSQMFQDPEFAKSNLGKTELVHKDALAEYFSKSRSRDNSTHWKNRV